MALFHFLYLCGALYIGTVVLSSMIPKKVPSKVAFAGNMEICFGILFFLLSYFMPIFKIYSLNIDLQWIIVNGVGVLWLFMGVFLFRGSRTSRWLCLFISIVRALTIIGAIFSIISIQCLFFDEESKKYFEVKNEIENDNK